MSVRLASLCLALFLSAGCTSLAAQPRVSADNDEKVTSARVRENVLVQTIDDRQLQVRIDRPEGEGTSPILVVVDGSGCGGSAHLDGLAVQQDVQTQFARVVVEKYGVNASDDGQTCSEDYFKHYTMNGRVEEHLRVLQHLSANAPWWNGELYLFGWSDGGDIAAQLLSYYPTVKRAVIGGMGGGYTMAEHFKTYWACPQDAGEDTQACEESLDEQFAQMHDNPRWDKTEFGPDNSWRAWASRLNTRLANTLVDVRSPFLIVHGENDFNGTPVESARKLVEALEQNGEAPYTYWEVSGMEHSFMTLPPENVDLLLKGMMAWLFDEPAPDGMNSLLVTNTVGEAS